MKIFSFIIISFAILAACSEEPPITGTARNNQDSINSEDAGFGTGMISDPCAPQGNAMGQPVATAQINTGLPELPQEPLPRTSTTRRIYSWNDKRQHRPTNSCI